MSYYDSIKRGIPGLPFGLADIDGTSHAAEGGVVAFGRAVVEGVGTEQDINGEKTCSLPDKASAYLVDAATGQTYAAASIALPLTGADLKFLGGSVRTVKDGKQDNALMLPFGSGDDAYAKETQTVTVATRGWITVEVEAEVNSNDPVYFRHTISDPATQKLGLWTNTASAEVQLVSGAKFKDGCSFVDGRLLAVINLG